MDVIPAIDLKEGKCVRLLQGSENAVTEYSDDPVAVAHMWVEEGARRLHVVNLDGAFGRSSRNLEIVQEIVCDVRATVQLGGGLRSLEDIDKALSLGVERVILGTVVIENPGTLQVALSRYGAGKVIVAIDGLKGKVATRGWKSVSDVEVAELAQRVQDAGVHEIVYTDIARDGMMTGPDTSGIVSLAKGGLRVIASGGISSKEDVLGLAMLGEPRITGVIIGKALYEKRIHLGDLLKEIALC